MFTKKQITSAIKITVLSAILIVGLNYANAAWSGPTGTAPSGGIATPVNLSSINQIKNGGLGINALSVFGDALLGKEVSASQLCLDGCCISSWSDNSCGANMSGNVVAPNNSSYSHPQSMGNRNSLITITTDTIWNYNGYPNTNALDGSYSTVTYTTSGLVSIAGHKITFDFHTAVIITEARYWWATGGPQGFTSKWQGSNNNSTWTDLSANFSNTTGSTNPVILGDLSGNSTAYRYYRWMGVSGEAYNNGGMSEIEFKIVQ